MKDLSSLDERFQTELIKKYYSKLNKRKMSLFLKLVFDKVVALAMLLGLSPLILFLSIWIKLDSEGPIFYR